MKKTFRTFLAATIATVSLNALAANDGNVSTGAGASSSGNFDITLNINTAIVVRNFDDMTLNVDGTTPGVDIVGRENICVGGVGVSQYSVLLDSANGTGSFILNGDVSHSMPYTVNYANDTALASLGDTATDNTTIVPATNYLVNGDLGCSGGDTSQVIVTVPATSWETATDSIYTDTLTVTVTAL